MGEVKLGVLLWSQASDWASFERAARRVDELGYDHLWTWDHLYAIFGDPYQPIFEGWTTLAAWAKATERIRLGLLVGANTFRNPGLVAKIATTLDHISDGRAILGIGGAWIELEHTRPRHRLRDAASASGSTGSTSRSARMRARARRRVGHLGAGRPLRSSTTCATSRCRSRRTCRS